MTSVTREPRDLEGRVLDAAKACVERWGVAKVTIDDIAAESGVSRATLYRLFPGGKDVLFEAMRVKGMEVFFNTLRSRVHGHVDLEDLLVGIVVAATTELRADQHLALTLASEPGEVLGQLTVEGLPRIMRVASVLLVPMIDEYLPRAESARLVELLARLVISCFLAPTQLVDFGDAESARDFLRTFIIPAFQPALVRS
jgi:AcrR family transcriptional regulator